MSTWYSMGGSSPPSGRVTNPPNGPARTAARVSLPPVFSKDQSFYRNTSGNTALSQYGRIAGMKGKLQ
jgi:hypothetical protein